MNHTVMTAVDIEPAEIAVGQVHSVLPGSQGNIEPGGGIPSSGKSTDPATAIGWFAMASLCRPLAFYFIGLAGLFGVTELTLAFMNKQAPPPSEFERWQPAPYIEFYSEPDYHGGGLDTNDAGFRYGPLPLAKPSGETRIFFLGTSTGFVGGTNQTTIAGFMERRLSASSQATEGRIRVVNAAVNSFVMRQSLILLVTRILDYEPDVIVVFHGPEVLFNATARESRPGYPANFAIREYQHARLREKLQGPNPLISLVMWTRTMKWFHPDLARKALQPKISQHYRTTRIDTVEGYDPYIDVVVGDVDKLIRIAAVHGCRTVVAVPPWRPPDLMSEAVPRLVRRLRTAIERRGEAPAVFVDATPLADRLDARGLWWPDGIHWTDEGNRMMADLLVQAIHENGLLE